MYNLINKLPERPAFDWLDNFITPVCSTIKSGKDAYMDEHAERALYEALFVRLFSIAQNAIYKECCSIMSSKSNLASLSMELVPADIRRSSSEELRDRLSEGGRYALDGRFPLLRGRLEKAAANFESAVEEMISGIMLHREEISSTFFGGRNFDRITDISFGGADTHNSGRATARIDTEVGSFMYKPHDVRQGAFVGEVVDRFFSDRIRVPKSLDIYDGSLERHYGFCEFIVNSPAADEKSAAEYYRNMGGFAAVTHMLGSTDMHLENLLSDGVHPIPVDMETCFMPRYRKDFTGSKENSSIERDIRNSVIINGMFPARINGEFEMSPLVSEDKRNASMPVADGKHISVYRFLNDYYEGFQEIYMRCMERRSEILEMLKTAPDFEVRIVLRPTNYYAKLQVAVSDEEHLGSSEAVETKMEERLHFNPHKIDSVKWRNVIECEKASIRNEDIPYFFTTAHSLTVYDISGMAAENVFERSAIDVAVERLERFSDRDLESEIRIQKQLIERAQIPKNNDFAPERYEDIWSGRDSDQIAEGIIRDAIELQSGGRCWFTTIDQAGRNIASPGYYRGVLGIVSVLQMYRKLHPETDADDIIQEQSEICLCTISGLSDYLEKQGELIYPEFNINLENGCAGWIESLMRLYRITGDDRFLSAARKCRKLIEKYRLTAVKDISRRNGVAGVLEILCRYHDELEVNDQLIRKFADHLLERKTVEIDGLMLWHPIGKKRAVSGMDCGMAGIGKALHMAGRLLGEEKYTEAAEDAWTYERKVFNESKGGWQDMFRSTVSPERYGGFSSGNAGLGFLWLYLDDREMLEKAVSSVLESEPVFSDRLRDGKLGTCDFLIEAGRRLNRPELTDRARSMVQEMLSRPRHYSERQYHQVFEPTLFNGEAGLLYVMLRLEAADQIESILM